MDPLNINHSNVLYSSTGIKPINDVPSETIKSEPTEVKLLEAESKVIHDSNIKSRFISMEEQSNHVTNIAAQWVTLEELESGTRRPFATAEDERLSKLTLKELMEEANNLPRVDKNGHLQTGFAGTAQGDRINIAIANKVLEAQYVHKTSSQRVETSVKNFKIDIDKKLNISPESYDIVFSNGKIIATGRGADEQTLMKIQEVIDNPKNMKSAMKLSAEIEEFNKAALALVENELTQYIYGAAKDPYLEKNVSIEWLMEGMNYSNATKSGQINYKFTAIIADARAKYHEAIRNGTHLSNYDIDPGIIELTNLRKNINTNV